MKLPSVLGALPRRDAPAWRVYGMALVTIILWGASFPLTKVALNETGPIAIAFLRWSISALVLAGWLGWRRRSRAAPPLPPLTNRTKWAVVNLALAGVVIFYCLENVALRLTTATNVGVLSNLTPIFIALIATVLLRERVRKGEWLGLAAALIGAALVSQGAGHLTVGGPGLLGDGLMALAGVFGALYSVGAKPLTEKYGAELILTLVAGLGALGLAPLALWEGLRLDLSPAGWAAVLALGLGAGALANLWWLTLLAQMRAARAALALYLIPLVSAFLSVTYLGEPLTGLTVVGAGLVLGGVYCAQH